MNGFFFTHEELLLIAESLSLTMPLGNMKERVELLNKLLRFLDEEDKKAFIQRFGKDWDKSENQDRPGR